MAIKLKSTESHRKTRARLQKQEREVQKSIRQQASSVQKTIRRLDLRSQKKADQQLRCLRNKDQKAEERRIKRQTRKENRKKSFYSVGKLVSFTGLLSFLSMLLLIYLLLYLVVNLSLLLFTPQYDDTVFTDMVASVFSGGDRSYALLILMGLALFMVVSFRKKRAAFLLALSEGLKIVFVEIKLAVAGCSLWLAFSLGNLWLILLCVMMIGYLFCLDIGQNHRLFSHNLIHSSLEAANRRRKEMTFEQLFSKRLFRVIFVILGVAFLSVLLFLLLFFLVRWVEISSRRLFFILASITVFSLAGIVGSVSWYHITTKKDLDDLSLIFLQIEEMYGGNLDAVNHVPPGSNFYDIAMQLNMIRTGIEKAVEEGVKADRTKVELITNVSHDIKTPLTSIISYVELLKLEKGLSPTAIDYVQTISNKANRLRSIVQDVFEISKAATGNLNLNQETLDIGKLLEQTMAEMEEDMNAAPITWRIELPDLPAPVYADGQKLYRVFQNLIRNCTQYSLTGSRAYVSMTLESRPDEPADLVNVILRNISQKELDPSAAEYLTGRFVRGDQTRSTEGSGLGLSIAKSFTEACGGKFILQIDGDVFYAIVQFPLLQRTAFRQFQEELPGAPSALPNVLSEANSPSAESSSPAEFAPVGESVPVSTPSLEPSPSDSGTLPSEPIPSPDATLSDGSGSDLTSIPPSLSGSIGAQALVDSEGMKVISSLRPGHSLKERVPRLTLDPFTGKDPYREIRDKTKQSHSEKLVRKKFLKRRP